MAVDAQAAPPGHLHLLVGGYGAEGNPGLTPIDIDRRTETWRTGRPLMDIQEASFGVYSTRFSCAYVVGERDVGQVLAVSSGGSIGGAAPSGGAAPCHLALDARQRFLAVANYGSGSVGLLRLSPKDGRPGEPQVIAHHGQGPVAGRQAGSHAHWVGFSPDQRWLHAVDLGADAIFAHPFDPVAGTIADGGAAWRAPAGSGPRHLARHPRLPRAYLVSELANTVTTLEVAPHGRFRTAETVSTLPHGFGGESAAAHIAINTAGTRLYVSNRGHDSLAVFAIAGGGQLTLLQHVDCGGAWPRFFLLLDTLRQALVANERSGSLAVFAIMDDGRLRYTGRRLALSGAAVALVMG